MKLRDNYEKFAFCLIFLLLVSIQLSSAVRLEGNARIKRMNERDESDDSDEQPDDEQDQFESLVPSEKDGEPVSKFPIVNTTAIDQDKLAKVIKSSNIFALRFYAVLRKLYPNFVFSPVSIIKIMGLILRGSNGLSMKQVYEAMGFKESGLTSISEVQIGISSLCNYLQSNAAQTKEYGYQLSMASSMWFGDDRQINTKYFEDAKLHYNTKIAGLNFKNWDMEAHGKINRWVIEKSHGTILSCGMRQEKYNRDTDLVIMNTMFFSAYWGNEFQSNMETWHNFSSLNRQSIRTIFLQTTALLPYAKDPESGAELLEIPFHTASSGNNHSLIVILPGEEDTGAFNLSAVEDHFLEFQSDDIRLFKALNYLTPTRLNIKIPKHVSKNEIKLHRLLPIIGLESPFEEYSSDLIYISALERLTISSMYHESVFEFKKKGTSPKVVNLGSFQPDMNIEQPFDSKILPYFADRPFMFTIVEKATNALLYIGKVSVA